MKKRSIQIFTIANHLNNWGGFNLSNSKPFLVILCLNQTLIITNSMFFPELLRHFLLKRVERLKYIRNICHCVFHLRYALPREIITQSPKIQHRNFKDCKFNTSPFYSIYQYIILVIHQQQILGSFEITIVLPEAVD